MKLSLTFSKRLWLLAMLFLLGLCLAGGITAVVSAIIVNNATAAARIGAVAQTLLAFIMPAVAAAMLSTRLPARLLRIDRAPRLDSLLLSLVVTVVAIPAINAVNELFAGLPWPDQVLAAEVAAEAAVELLTGPHTAANLAVSIMIIGVLTGLGEELFFRGALQRLLQSRPMPPHAAIWIAAALFSLIHAQPVGFVPRMILGAMFGYMATWTASTWTAVAAHALNNSLAVAVMYTGFAVPRLSIVSALLAAGGMWLLRRQSRSRSSGM